MQDTHDTSQNPFCPDHTSHYQNVADLLFPGRSELTVEEDETVLAAAEVEYRACEGH